MNYDQRVYLYTFDGLYILMGYKEYYIILHIHGIMYRTEGQKGWQSLKYLTENSYLTGYDTQG